ncbi:MAG: SGNH/GDSL hydrolase family protein [Pseudomonadota bacterium]
MRWRHYVALGDSISAGSGDNVAGIEALRWPDRLARTLRQLNPGLRYDNLAQHGHTAEDILARQYPEAEALRPDLVSILCGGNDVLSPHWSPTQYRGALEKLFGAFKLQGATVISFTLLNPASVLPPRLAARTCARLDQAHSVVRDLSEQYGCVCVDCWGLASTHDPGIWSADRKHPNALAHQLIAAEVARCLHVTSNASL